MYIYIYTYIYNGKKVRKNGFDENKEKNVFFARSL